MNDWIFRDGKSETKWPSFPTAYRSMWNVVKKGVEGGRKYADMMKELVIISPIKDVHGDCKKYSYTAATELANSSGLLTPDGQINSREFKRK